MNENGVLLPRHSAGAGGQEVALHGHHPHGVVRVEVPQQHSPHHIPDLLTGSFFCEVNFLDLKARPEDKASAGSLRVEENTAADMFSRHLSINISSKQSSEVILVTC